MRRLRAIHGATLALVLVACGGDGPADTPHPDAQPDAQPVPVFRNPRPDLTDDALATQALQLLGARDPGTDDNCDVCHALTPTKLRSWLDLSNAALSNCLTNLDFGSMTADEAAETVQCLRSDPGVATSRFHPDRLGIYATAVSLPWFEYLFTLSGDDGSRLAALVRGARMPRGAIPSFTQDEFDVIAEWFARDLPLVETLLPGPPPMVCAPSISAEMQAHVATMATAGWRAVNAAAGMEMHGCASASSPRECLSDYPRALDTSFGAGWEAPLPGSQLRILHTTNYSSQGFTRTSPDGRFVAHGERSLTASDRGVVIDLERDALVFLPDMLFHPAFFPDGRGFLFQRLTPSFNTVLCAQNPLTAVPPRSVILSDDPQCNIWYGNTLQQHLARALDGGSYWSVYGTIGGEFSGGALDPSATFADNAVGHLVPLGFDGVRFTPQAAIDMSLPYEGDVVPSPSGRLLVTRIAGNNQQEGYRVRALEATPSGGTYTVATPILGEYCVNGGKPSVSFDERFMTYSHAPTHLDAAEYGYAPNDPAFQDNYLNKVTNIYVLDLLTGERTRVTNMQSGSNALFPQFRSDGWIYFLVRSGGQTEYVVASDAALLIAGE